MAKHMISAEVEPIGGQASQAALALQRLGFRVLHMGPTISVQGSDSLWTSTFRVSFKLVKKTIGRETEKEVTYHKPSDEEVKIPASIENLIARVMFVEPPEYFGIPGGNAASPLTRGETGDEKAESGSS